MIGALRKSVYHVILKISRHPSKSSQIRIIPEMYRLNPNRTIPHSLERALRLRRVAGFGALEATGLEAGAAEGTVRIAEGSPEGVGEALAETRGHVGLG